jgi:hypothetical protein
MVVQARKTMQRIHQADFGGIVGKLTAQYDAQQAVERDAAVEGELSLAAQASLARTSSGTPNVGKALDSVWMTGRQTISAGQRRLPSMLRGATETNADLPTLVFDESATKSRVNRGLKGMSAEELDEIQELQSELDISTVDVLRYFETFATFDKDGSGVLDVSELKQVFDVLGETRSVHEDFIRMMIADIGLDEDADGEVHFREFLTMMVSQKKKVDQDEELEESFKIFLQSRSKADNIEGHVQGESSAHQGNVELSVPPKVLLYQLRSEGLVDDNVELDSKVSSEQEDLVRAMVRVANRFAPAGETGEQGGTGSSDDAAGADNPDDVTFSAGSAVGASMLNIPTPDGGATGGTFENPIRDSMTAAQRDEDKAVGYGAYRAMMCAIADPRVSALEVARINELDGRSRQDDDEEAAVKRDAAAASRGPRRERFETIG